MATKIKGIYKGFKYFTQIFVVKEQEMEIGYPTDVKHVAHIGWDGPNGSGPSWMNEFKTAPDFSTSIGSLSERRDLNQRAVTTSGSTQDTEGVAHVPKKPKRKKTKSTSSPKSSSASSRQSRAPRSKAMYCDLLERTNTNCSTLAGSRQ